jgi:hypothetical protein
LTLADRLVDKVELALLQVSDAAVNQPRGAARRPAREVVSLHQGDVQPTHGRIARHAAACDASSNYEKVEFFSGRSSHSRKARRVAESAKVYGI